MFYMLMGLVAADEYCTTNYLGQPSQSTLCSPYCCGTYDYRYCCSDCTKSYVSTCSTYGLPNSCSHCSIVGQLDYYKTSKYGHRVALNWYWILLTAIFCMLFGFVCLAAFCYYLKKRKRRMMLVDSTPGINTRTRAIRVIEN